MIKNYHFQSSNTKFFARPLIASDKDLLKVGFTQLSENSKYYRFFVNRKTLNDLQLSFLTEIDGVNHIAWGIVDETNNNPVAVGRLVKIKAENDIAEMAITVIDSYQKMGIGRILYTILNNEAYKVGIKTLRYHVLYNNRIVLKKLNKLGITHKKIEGSLVTLETNVFNQPFTIPSNFKIDDLVSRIKEVENSIQ